MNGRSGFTTSGRERARRQLAVGLFAMVVALIGVPTSAKAAPCGGQNQRACCVATGERTPDGKKQMCRSGFIARPGCRYGDKACQCFGKPWRGWSLDHCAKAPECGGEGQRACKTNERTEEHPLPCKGHLVERGTCKTNCQGSIGVCVKPPCGAEGQRACCVLESPYACAPGLFQMPGVHGDAKCKGGWATGTCARPSPAGGPGQRARCSREERGRGPCDKGLKRVKGCSGDCFCDSGREHNVPVGWKAEHTCTTAARITGEPFSAWKPPATPPANPMRGYADMHVHLFGHMGHGGAIVAGKPYHKGADGKEDINEALRGCFGHREQLLTLNGARVATPSCPEHQKGCGKSVHHGDHELADYPTLSPDGTFDGASGNWGAPNFSGWPRWSSTGHQQVYYRWLERAWRGGLRIMTALAGTNEIACKTSRRLASHKCNKGMDVINEQLTATHDFEKFVDALSGGKGKGWFRIVRSPGEARAAIKKGKLAVVLGIEMASLFDCKEGGTCNATSVRANVDTYFKKGVRHIFPIHNFDDAFGGAATWQDIINVGNRLSQGRFWEVENCHKDGYGFWLRKYLPPEAGFPDEFRPFWRRWQAGERGVAPRYPVGERKPIASCNTRGLTSLGEVLVTALMDKGMLIDVDHMSRHSLNKTLSMAKARKYPLVAGHVLFMDQHLQRFKDSKDGNRGRHERMRTKAQLEAIRDGGGLVAAMLKDEVQDSPDRGQKVTVPFKGASVSDACRHSTRTFAQSLLYGIDTMKGPVAFGSDFNGLAGHFGPRFGSDACGGDPKERALQVKENKRLQYPFTLDGFGKFNKLTTGEKTFDYNVDGLAHIGLMPDLLADLLTIGVTKQQLEPVFRSAEAYVNVWERAMKAAKRQKPDLWKGAVKKK